MQQHHSREAMSNVDKFWLSVDGPTNLMIINGAMLFDEPLEFERLHAVCEQRLVGRFVRFRQRVVESSTGAGQFAWETDPHFDVRAHLHHIALPGPGDMATLQNLITDLMSSGLDHNRPLWRFYLIDNVAGGCALFGRFHHCIADGIALIQVLLSLTDADAYPPSSPLNPPPGQQDNLPPRASSGLAMLAKRVRNLTRMAEQAAGILWQEGQRALKDPIYALEMAKSAGIISVASAAIIGKLLLIPTDRDSIFKGTLTPIKRVTWSEPIPLDLIKTIGRAANATVNDVLMAAVAGALRRYLLATGDPVEKGIMRVMAPVNLRPQDEALQLGNRFSLVYLALPVSVADPKERLYYVKERMDILKQSPEPFLVYQLLNLLGLAPGEFAKPMVQLFASKVSAVLTNVPGPRQTLYFAGKPIRRLLFWVPQSGQIGMGISIISYAGSVTLGIAVDENLVADPAPLLVAFQEEVAHFVKTFSIIPPEN